MSMFSEVARENVVAQIVVEIKKELEESREKPEVCSALKKLGRFTLTLFDYSTPEWAKEYQQIFDE